MKFIFDKMRKIYLFLLFFSYTAIAQTGIGTTTPAVKLHVKSNGPTFRLEGSDHTYMEFYPQGSSTRFGWFGFPSANSNDLILSNQNASGSLAFNTNNSERFRINSSGFVGIGTSSPTSPLTVGNATGTIGGEITLNPTAALNEGGQIIFKKSLNGSTSDWNVDQYGTSASDARFRIFSTSELNGLVIKENGFIGMGISNPTVRLQVNGDIIANSIAGSSDLRFKSNIKPVENALAKVKSLRGVYFNWNQKAFPEKNFNDKTELGFIAQEVEKVLPEVVFKDTTPEEYRSIKYDKVVALLVEAIKEQQKQIDSLKIQVQKLKKKKNSK